jgi:Tol biopolymer transport system component
MASHWYFSAVRDGQNDLYLLRAGGRAEQLTNDLFDDVQPVFLPGGQGIVFSSNRYLDSRG